VGLGAMEVCSSTEMGVPGASQLGTGNHGPKTHRSRPRFSLVNGHPPGCVVAKPLIGTCRQSGEAISGLITSDIGEKYPLVGVPQIFLLPKE
jgi:hypothetical protein